MSTPPTKEETDSSNANSAPPKTAAKAMSIPSRVPPGTCFKGIVTVEVGPDKTAFKIHKDLLVFYSDYFRGAFNGSFQEAVEGKLSLPDECVDVFNAFNTFIYTRQFCSEGDSSTVDSALLCRLWVFGDKYLAPSVQNGAIDLLTHKSYKEKKICTTDLHYIYDNTLPGSPLRKIVLDWVTYRADIDKFLAPDMVERWSKDMLVDLVKLFYHKETKLAPMPTRDRCYYHVHPEGEKCEEK
ncbi:hypothetical protein D6C95_09884 [Aureobasidium pullulans]|nr:hypothetical protein D6C95_09884 [Aureobasidium pullulans]